MVKRFEKRSLISMFLYTLITFGFYHLYWLVKTKGELNRHGAPHIPTAWLLIIPFANLYFMWMYAQSFAKYVTKDNNGLLYFIVLLLLPFISIFILQHYINNSAEQIESSR